MKIIHYIGSLGFGGIERLVHDLITQQTSRKDLEVSLGVGNVKGEFENQFNNLVNQLEDFNLKSGNDLNPRKIVRISNHLKGFDIIHLHGFHLSVVLAALWSRKKIVYTEHGNFGFGRQIKKTDKLSFFLRKLFFRYTNVSICCNSNFTKSYVSKHFYKGNRHKVIYNGSAIESFIKEDLKNKLKKKYGEDNFIIGTSSRLAGFKKISRLLTVFSKYVEINSKSILVIVGDGVLRKELEQQALQLNIEDKVIFEGYQQNVATYQSVFDICVFPSKNEPFGLVAVECFSKKKPVLVFADGGGLTEIVNRFVPEDICENYDEMLLRFEHYEKQVFEWNSNFSKHLEFFSLERMETDYYIEYKNALSLKL